MCLVHLFKLNLHCKSKSAHTYTIQFDIPGQKSTAIKRGVVAIHCARTSCSLCEPCCRLRFGPQRHHMSSQKPPPPLDLRNRAAGTHMPLAHTLPCRRQRNLTDLLPLCAHDLEERGEEVAPIPLATISIAD